MTIEELTATYEAEEGLLGAILIEATHDNRKAISKVALIICANDFHIPISARVFSAMVSCPGSPHQINVAREMHRKGILQEEDCAYLCHCVSIVPCSLDYEDYAQAVRYYSEVRQGKSSVRIRGAK